MQAAKALLEGGADINQVSASEKTSPLVMASMNGHFDLARLFVDWGADPNLSNIQGLTALYAALDLQWAPKGWFPAPGVGQEKVTYLNLMRALLDSGANPNARITKKLWFRSLLGRYGRSHAVLARRPVERRRGHAASRAAWRRS
jgi:hypothetical protein